MCKRRIYMCGWVKTLALALTIVLLAANGAGLAETFYPNQVDYCDEYVTLRAKPSGSANALDYVYWGDVVMAAPYNGEFSYCCYNGKFGYIKSHYLTSQVSVCGEGTFYVAHCDEWISLRDMPKTDGNVRAHVPLGATFDAVYYSPMGSYDPNGFAYVRYNGQYGWVLWRYVEPVDYPGWQ